MVILTSSVQTSDENMPTKTSMKGLLSFAGASRVDLVYMWGGGSVSKICSISHLKD